MGDVFPAVGHKYVVDFRVDGVRANSASSSIFIRS